MWWRRKFNIRDERAHSAPLAGESGAKNPLEEIGKLAREVDACFLVDAVHHIAHGPLDVQALDCDFLVFSGYELFSSHGSFHYGKEEWLNALKPYKVKPDKYSPPDKFEWGTRNQALFAAIVGVVDQFLWLYHEIKAQYEGKYLEYADNARALTILMDAIEKYELGLSKVVLTGFEDVPGLLDLPGVTIYGLTDLNRLNERDPTFSFLVDGIPDNEVVKRLWNEGAIALRVKKTKKNGTHLCSSS